MTKKTNREEVTTKVLTTKNNTKSKNETNEEEQEEVENKHMVNTKTKHKRRRSDKTVDSYKQTTMTMSVTKNNNVIKI